MAKKKKKFEKIKITREGSISFDTLWDIPVPFISRVLHGFMYTYALAARGGWMSGFKAFHIN